MTHAETGIGGQGHHPVRCHVGGAHGRPADSSSGVRVRSQSVALKASVPWCGRAKAQRAVPRAWRLPQEKRLPIMIIFC